MQLSETHSKQVASHAGHWAGANALVAGSAVFGASDYKEGMSESVC